MCKLLEIAKGKGQSLLTFPQAVVRMLAQTYILPFLWHNFWKWNNCAISELKGFGFVQHTEKSLRMKNVPLRPVESCLNPESRGNTELSQSHFAALSRAHASFKHTPEAEIILDKHLKIRICEPLANKTKSLTSSSFSYKNDFLPPRGEACTHAHSKGAREDWTTRCPAVHTDRWMDSFMKLLALTANLTHPK